MSWPTQNWVSGACSFDQTTRSLSLSLFRPSSVLTLGLQDRHGLLHHPESLIHTKLVRPLLRQLKDALLDGGVGLTVVDDFDKELSEGAR